MFLLVLLPFTLIGVALGADYSRALLAKRQATNAADVISMAGATAFSEGGDLTRLDPAQAQERAQAMFAQARSTGMLPPGLQAKLVSVVLSPDRSTVTVTLDFEVPELFIVGAIAPGALTELSGRVQRSASVCLPEDPARIAGAGCAYPVG
jgi:Flp pilus assembly protein TadG